MTHDRHPLTALSAPITYLGGLGLLAGSAVRAIIGPGEEAPGLVGSVARQGDWILVRGLVLVGLVHVSFGSFLAMQAYFGATFNEAVGPVVGVGLIRNVAPLLTGLTLVGLLAPQIIAELRGGRRPPGEPGRLTLERVAAAIVAGPILTLWGAAVGIAVGGLVAESMLGIAPALFFDKMLEMMQVRDVIGLVVKSSGFAGIAALLACFEGLRSPAVGAVADPGHDASAFRAAGLAVLAIMVGNFTWFNLAYLAGSPFGPGLVGAAP